MRRDELCEPELCPEEDAADDNRCDSCPIHQLNRVYNSDKGLRISAANEMLVLLDTGFTIDWDTVPADLALACAIVKSERQRLSVSKDTPPSTPVS